ncbi:MAG: NADH-ubiquinone oxidoreductase-F iron-sulfur binding region domain-containing protein [Sphingomonadaceae bacterium]
MPIQLAGNIRHGGHEVAFGITLGELVHDIGGGIRLWPLVKAVQVGGPLGAYIHPDQFDIPFDYEVYAAADALIGHAGITVFDDGQGHGRDGSVSRWNSAPQKAAAKCTPCRLGSTCGVEVIDRIRAGGRKLDTLEQAPQMHNMLQTGRSREDEIALLTDLCETMQFGSPCALGGFTPIR